MEWSDWVGRRVIAKTGIGDNYHNKGTVISFCDAPTFTIQAKHGHRFSWRCDLCELEETEEEQLRSALKATDLLARDTIEMLSHTSIMICGYSETLERNAKLLGLDDVD